MSSNRLQVLIISVFFGTIVKTINLLFRGITMDNNELAEIIGEAFLWDIVSEYIGKDFENIKEELRHLIYTEKTTVEKKNIILKHMALKKNT